jgi:hypothetical protein
MHTLSHITPRHIKGARFFAQFHFPRPLLIEELDVFIGRVALAHPKYFTLVVVEFVCLWDPLPALYLCDKFVPL